MASSWREVQETHLCGFRSVKSYKPPCASVTSSIHPAVEGPSYVDSLPWDWMGSLGLGAFFHMVLFNPHANLYVVPLFLFC